MVRLTVSICENLGFFRVLEFSFCPANAPQFDHFHGQGGAGLGSNGILRGRAGRGSNRFFRRGAGRGTPFAPRGGASIPGRYRAASASKKGGYSWGTECLLA